MKRYLILFALAFVLCSCGANKPTKQRVVNDPIRNF